MYHTAPQPYYEQPHQVGVFDDSRRCILTIPGLLPIPITPLQSLPGSVRRHADEKRSSVAFSRGFRWSAPCTFPKEKAAEEKSRQSSQGWSSH